MIDFVFDKDLVYIAGKLNGMACDYIQNLATMVNEANYIQENYDFATFCPGNDLIQGIVHKKMGYSDYLRNSMENLKRCSAMYVCPDSEESEGVNLEKQIAQLRGIPIFDDLDDLYFWEQRPKILAITGKSGSGKTTICEYIEGKYGIKMVESHTDRPKRSPDETSHTFHSPNEYDQKCKREDMIAFTQWGTARYCCLKEDILPENTYVLDEKGLVMMNENYKSLYKIFKLHIMRPINARIKDVGLERVERDDDNFWLPKSYYNYVLANSVLADTYDMVDTIVSKFFNKSNQISYM